MQVYNTMSWLRDCIQVANPFLDIFRWLGYNILMMLAHGLDLCSNAVNGVLGVDVTKIDTIQSLVTAMSPVAWAILTVSIAATAFSMILYPGKNKELFKNLLVSIMLMVATPFLMSMLSDFKTAGVTDIQAHLSSQGQIGQQQLRTAVVSVNDSTKKLTTLSDKVNPYYLDVNATLPNDGTWKYKVTSVSGDNSKGYTMYGSELSDGGWFGIGKEQIYAYHFDFVIPCLSMLVSIIAIAFAGFKIARAVYDLLVHQIIAMPVFASDINGGMRTKKFLQSLVGLNLTIMLVLLTLKVFIDLSAWINLNISDIVVRLLMLAGAAWGVIDGPDVFMRIIGIDAGVRSGTNVLLGANAAINASRGIAGIAGGALNAAGNIAGAATAVPKISSQIQKGAEAARSGEFASGAEFRQSLAKGAQGAHGITQGQLGIANKAAEIGFRHAKIEDALKPHVSQGAAKDSSSQGNSGTSTFAKADMATMNNLSPTPDVTPGSVDSSDNNSGSDYETIHGSEMKDAYVSTQPDSSSGIDSNRVQSSPMQQADQSEKAETTKNYREPWEPAQPKKSPWSKQ